MMHYAETIVTLTDSNGTSLREYEANRQDNGRKCKVVIPFDTEYKIFIKNQESRRIKLEITLDGTVVSGGGLIIPAYSAECIERFVDSAKKFKFVRASNEAVADPTNRENGVLRVRVTKEQDPTYYVPPKVVHHYHPVPAWPWMNGPYYAGYSKSGETGERLDSSELTDTAGYNDVAPLYSGSVPPAQNCSGGILRGEPQVHYTSCSLGAGSPVNLNQLQAKSLVEAGATVEGGHSNQTFGTTHWHGDLGSPTFFTFHLVGNIDPEYQKYLELKKKFG